MKCVRRGGDATHTAAVPNPASDNRGYPARSMNRTTRKDLQNQGFNLHRRRPALTDDESGFRIAVDQKLKPDGDRARDDGNGESYNDINHVMVTARCCAYRDGRRDDRDDRSGNG